MRILVFVVVIAYCYGEAKNIIFHLSDLSKLFHNPQQYGLRETMLMDERRHRNVNWLSEHSQNLTQTDARRHGIYEIQYLTTRCVRLLCHLVDETGWRREGISTSNDIRQKSSQIGVN